MPMVVYTEEEMIDAANEAEATGIRRATERAARIAREGCLVPPDGGSPSNAEREICDAIAARIMASLGSST